MADSLAQLLRWLAAHDTPQRVLLVCADTPAPRVARSTLVVRARGCLADLGLDLPAQLLVSGVGVVVVAPCATAPRSVAARLAQWQRAFPGGVTAFDPPRRGRRPEVLTLGEIPLPRRAVLGLGLRDAGVLDHRVDDAARTLVAMRALREQGRARLDVPAGAVTPEPTPAPAMVATEPTPAPETVTTGPTSAGAAAPAAPAGAEQDGTATPGLRLMVEGCVACGVCVHACPHDALVLEHVGETSTLSHDREACRGELECVALCPVGAMSSDGALSLVEVLDDAHVMLAEVTTAACVRCRARHPAAEGELCQTCSFRGANAFGSSLPPGVAARLAARRPPTVPDDH